jgi:hypothetical protein
MRSYQDRCFIVVSNGFKFDVTRAVRMARIAVGPAMVSAIWAALKGI